MLGLIMVLLTIVVVEYPHGPHAHFYNSTPSPCSFTPIIHPPPPRLISFSAGFKTTLYQRIYCLLI